MSIPYFPMYPTDFEADTSHLTLAEDGAFNRLLRIMWMTADCSIPDDDKWIMRRLRVTQEVYEEVVLVVIDEFFVRSKGRVSNARLSKEFTKTNEAHSKRVLAGSKGGKSKSLKTKSLVSSNAKAMLKQPEPEPEPKDDLTSSRESRPPDDDDFVNLCFGVFNFHFPFGSIRDVETCEAWKNLNVDLNKEILPALSEACKHAKSQPASWRYFDKQIRSLVFDRDKAVEAVRRRNKRLMGGSPVAPPKAAPAAPATSGLAGLVEDLAQSNEMKGTA